MGKYSKQKNTARCIFKTPRSHYLLRSSWIPLRRRSLFLSLCASFARKREMVQQNYQRYVSILYCTFIRSGKHVAKNKYRGSEVQECDFLIATTNSISLQCNANNIWTFRVWDNAKFEMFHAVSMILTSLHSHKMSQTHFMSKTQIFIRFSKKS